MNFKLGQKVMVVYPPTAAHSAITYMSEITRISGIDPIVIHVKRNFDAIAKFDHRGKGLNTDAFIITVDEVNFTLNGKL